MHLLFGTLTAVLTVGMLVYAITRWRMVPTRERYAIGLTCLAGSLLVVRHFAISEPGLLSDVAVLLLFIGVYLHWRGRRTPPRPSE